MTTHVLIVDATTFKLHLEYMFAGTGARDLQIDFNNSAHTALHPTRENNLASMIADGCRIRPGDRIIFYLQQDAAKGIREGKFFGIFQARHSGIFLDDNDGRQYLASELGKSLTFRTLIDPAAVYAEGVTEWEALDEIRHIAAPCQMLWSLIYRKLKGNRGNTMITIYEAERLAQLIRNKNDKAELRSQGTRLTFDAGAQRIAAADGPPPAAYAGRQTELNLLPRLLAKYQAGNAFETHLQAYLTQNLGTGINASLDAALLDGGEIEWLGNEVACGVGMQRIDLMASLAAKNHRVVLPVELKSVPADADNLSQIQRYVDWIEQYYIPNRPSDIQPLLIAKHPEASGASRFQRFVEAALRFNQTNQNRTYPLKYIEVSLLDGGLHFREVAIDGQGG